MSQKERMTIFPNIDTIVYLCHLLQKPIKGPSKQNGHRRLLSLYPFVNDTRQLNRNPLIRDH